MTNDSKQEFGVGEFVDGSVEVQAVQPIDDVVIEEASALPLALLQMEMSGE
jgi:hypothetical protein